MSSNLKLILQRGFALQFPSHRPLQSPHTEDTHKRTSSSIWSADCYISSCYRLCTTRCASLCASSLRLRISIVYISRDFFAFVVESNANRVSFIVCYLAVIAACVNIMPIVSSTSNPLYAAGGGGMGRGGGGWYMCKCNSLLLLCDAPNRRSVRTVKTQNLAKFVRNVNMNVLRVECCVWVFRCVLFGGASLQIFRFMT